MLYGYKPTQQKAAWTRVFPAQLLKLQAKVPHKPKLPKVRRYIAPVAKRNQASKAEYRREAAAYVAAAVARGETCPVVAAIAELREGFRYGWAISAQLVCVHHMRGKLGPLLLDKRGWMACSLQGHRWIHSNQEEARKRGWLCERGLWHVPFTP